MLTPAPYEITFAGPREFIVKTADWTFILSVTRRGSTKVRASGFRNAVRELDSPVALQAVPMPIRRVAYAHFNARRTPHFTARG